MARYRNRNLRYQRAPSSRPRPFCQYHGNYTVIPPLQDDPFKDMPCSRCRAERIAVMRARKQLESQGKEITAEALLDLGQQLNSTGVLRRYGRNKRKGSVTRG